VVTGSGTNDTRLAIDGGTPVRTASFPAWPVFGKREEELLLEVLYSGQWSELTGSKVTTFMQQFAEFQDAAWGVPVPNGTLALEVALQALGVGFGDEIITTAYTFIATASSAFSVGARPIFVDIDPETNNIDPAKIEAAITPRTKAIVPVHIGGHPADMDAIVEIGKKHGIPVLEDAAQAWGSQWKGKGVGALGDIGTFSFQSSKNLNAGEGGAILTNNRELYNACWSLHNVGRLPEGGWYQHEILGRNLRLSEWNGAVLLAQFERLPAAMDTRTRNAERLNRELAELPGLTPIKLDDRVTRSSWHIYQLRVDPAELNGHTRDELLAALRAEGIPCSAGYVPLIHAPAIRNTLRDRFGEESLGNLTAVPHADHAGKHVVWMTQTMLLGSDDDISDIIRAFTKITHAWAHE
jgi:dTDP-4-amino-4,6-dideoxygalactose transaminase